MTTQVDERADNAARALARTGLGWPDSSDGDPSSASRPAALGWPDVSRETSPGTEPVEAMATEVSVSLMRIMAAS